VVESCAAQAVTRFALILCHLPEEIEHFLGDGKRWGSQFTYHLARDPARPYRLLRALHLQAEAPGLLLLGHADRLPLVRLDEAMASAPEGGPVLFCWDDAAVRRWTGWALLSPAQVAALPGDPDENELEAYLRTIARADHSWVAVPRPLSTVTFPDLLEAHQAVLTKAFPGLMLSGREADPGIWLARNVSLHPTAELV